MKAGKLLLNIVYPLLLLLLIGLAMLSVYQKEWLTSGIYLAGIVLALLLPRFIVSPHPKEKALVKKKSQKHENVLAKKAGFFARLFRKKHTKEKKQKHEHAHVKKAGFFARLFHKKHTQKKKHEKAHAKKAGFFANLFRGKDHKKEPKHKTHHERKGFFARLFKRKHAGEKRKDETIASEKEENKKPEKQGFIKRLFKTKKVLKVYQGKEEEEPKFVEERGEKKLELIEINKPVERKGTSKHQVMTDFDKLVDWINQKGIVSLTEAAKHFNLPNDKIEGWAKLLEEHGLLVIEYPTFGEIRLKAVKKA